MGSYSVTVTGTGGCTGTSSPTTNGQRAANSHGECRWSDHLLSGRRSYYICQWRYQLCMESGWATTNSITVTASGNYSVTATDASRVVLLYQWYGCNGKWRTDSR